MGCQSITLIHILLPFFQHTYTELFSEIINSNGRQKEELTFRERLDSHSSRNYLCDEAIRSAHQVFDKDKGKKCLRVRCADDVEQIHLMFFGAFNLVQHKLVVRFCSQSHLSGDKQAQFSLGQPVTTTCKVLPQP